MTRHEVECPTNNPGCKYSHQSIRDVIERHSDRGSVLNTEPKLDGIKLPGSEEGAESKEIFDH